MPLKRGDYAESAGSPGETGGPFRFRLTLGHPGEHFRTSPVTTCGDLSPRLQSRRSSSLISSLETDQLCYVKDATAIQLLFRTFLPQVGGIVLMLAQATEFRPRAG